MGDLYAEIMTRKVYVTFNMGWKAIKVKGNISYMFELCDDEYNSIWHDTQSKHSRA